MTWCRKNELISVNPCDSLDRADKPRVGKSRDHTPSIATLQKVWSAAEREQPYARDLLRLVLLLPLRRTEACCLRWREVDLEGRRIVLGAERMKIARDSSCLCRSPRSSFSRRVSLTRRGPTPSCSQLWKGSRSTAGTTRWCAFARRSVRLRTIGDQGLTRTMSGALSSAS